MMEWREHEPVMVEIVDGNALVVANNPMGGWNGYIVVPFGSLFWGKPYEDVNESVQIRGGFTFGCNAPQFMDRLFVPYASEEMRRRIERDGGPDMTYAWAFGFDTCHVGDSIPEERIAMLPEPIRTVAHMTYWIDSAMPDPDYPLTVWTPESVMSELRSVSPQMAIKWP